MFRAILLLLLLQGGAPAAVREIVTRLRGIDTEQLGTIVPPAVSADLTLMKHALRDLIAQTVRVSADLPP